MIERHFGNDFKNKWYFNSEVSGNGFLSGSKNGDYTSRKELYAMNHDKILRYVPFSSHKWENVPANQNRLIPINTKFIGKTLELGWYKGGSQLQMN